MEGCRRNSSDAGHGRVRRGVRIRRHRNPEVATFYAPSRFVSVLDLLRTAMAEISDGQGDAGAQKIREALGVLQSSVNSSPRLWTAAWTLLALASKPAGEQGEGPTRGALTAFQEHIRQALSWAKYDAQIPALSFLAVEFASTSAQWSSAGSGLEVMTDEAMAVFQHAAALSAESKNFHHSGKLGSVKDVVDSAAAVFGQTVAQVEGVAKAVSATTEADPKKQSLEWAVNGLRANQYQNGLYSHAATWSCSDFQVVPPEAKPYDVSSLEALMADGPGATPLGTVVCQWSRAAPTR